MPTKKKKSNNIMHLSIMRNFAIKKKLYGLTSSPSDRTKYTFSQKKKKKKRKKKKKNKRKKPNILL